jgi:hypothetical protein
MYWKNKFQPFPLLVVSTQARNMDKIVTHGLGYRNNLLEACVNIHSDDFCHRATNYPCIKTPRDTDVWQFWIKLSSVHNLTPVSQFVFRDLQPTAVPPSSEDLLKKTKLGEDIYAFGYDICEAYTTQ